MKDGPGVYNFPAMRRGDTFRARDIAKLTQATVPLALLSAKMHVRAEIGGEVILEFDTEAVPATAEIAGADDNVVRLLAKSSEIMQALPAGDHVYDLEVVFASDGAALTILAGKFPISADVTRPD